MRGAALSIPAACAVVLTACGGPGTSGGLTGQDARHRAELRLAQLSGGRSQLVYRSEVKGADPRGRDAWLVYFKSAGDGGCFLYANVEAVTAAPSCEPFLSSGVAPALGGAPA